MLTPSLKSASKNFIASKLLIAISAAITTLTIGIEGIGKNLIKIRITYETAENINAFCRGDFFVTKVALNQTVRVLYKI